MGEWQPTQFGDLYAEPSRNGLTKPKRVRGSGIKFINMGEIFRHDRLKNPECDRAPLTDKEKINSLLIPDDLLFARQSLVLKGAGKCSIFIGDEEEASFESHIIRVRLNRKISDPQFYFYLFKSPQGRSLIETIVEQGAGASGIRGSDLQNIVVPNPPLLEQHAIAALLGTLDEKIELNRRMNETLEAMARAIFKDWFVDFAPTRAKAEGRDPYLAPEIWDQFPDALDDDDRPVEWEVGSISDLADTNQQSWTARNHPPFVEYLDLSNAKWGNIDVITTLAWEEAPSRARRIAKAGDTIVGTTRPGNGSFAYISQDGLTVSTGFAVLSPRKAVYRDVVHIAATRPDNIYRLANLADGHGGAYPAVKPNEVSDTELVLPGDAILQAFAELVSPLRTKVEHAKAECRSLAQTRDLLLPKLMSGEVCLAEAEKTVEAVA